MKNMIKLGIVGVLLAVGLLQTYAQTTTQVVYNVTITLTGWGQATDTTVDPVTMTTKGLIAELAATKGITATAKTKLVVISVAGNTNAGPTFFLRDTTGGTNTDTDLTGVLSLDIIDDVHKVTTVGTKTATTRYPVVPRQRD
jgi:hypothetical protein